MSGPMLVAALPPAPAVPLPRSRGGTRARSAPPSVPASPSPGRRLACWVAWGAAFEVPRVRARLRRTLEAWGVALPCVDLLLLAGTELLSNAVLHAGGAGGAGGRLRVTVSLGGGRLQLDVADGDPRLPCLTQGAGPDADLEGDLGVDADAEGGRGLAITSFLVDEAGGQLAAFRAATGKVVRIRVPIA
ncbi:ATP-binding protein [Streptomyces sp. NPDC058579]|uniref:ATP-binding protein n=1 Tax=Streptomyces sp. NPDC058579 TaxID=3346548 RepID=UPI00364C9E2B